MVEKRASQDSETIQRSAGAGSCYLPKAEETIAGGYVSGVHGPRSLVSRQNWSQSVKQEWCYRGGILMSGMLHGAREKNTLALPFSLPFLTSASHRLKTAGQVTQKSRSAT